ncbi:hypothetical protein D3C73_1565850 [compost metagenome]
MVCYARSEDGVENRGSGRKGINFCFVMFTYWAVYIDCKQALPEGKRIQIGEGEYVFTEKATR